MPAIQSFAPIVDDGARTLILGSIPGKASLDAEEYYAHPRNAFWKIIGELFDVDPAASYAERVQGLKSHRIAVWDAMQACTREGSLDSDIIEDSIVPNAFQTFFDTYPEVRHIFFNGAKAEAAFRRYVSPELSTIERHLVLNRLPSTSPAHAGMKYEAKLAAWRAISACG